jgi:hypothetical protein
VLSRKIEPGGREDQPLFGPSCAMKCTVASRCPNGVQEAQATL